jgi:hypothetical protein
MGKADSGRNLPKKWERHNVATATYSREVAITAEEQVSTATERT